MELIDLLSFIAVAALLVISPGPNGALIAKTVPLAGRQAGFANVWGFVTAFYVHGTLSVFGISLILVQSAHAFLVFKLLGAAYLIYIGIKALWEAWRHTPSAVRPQPTNTQKTPSLTAAFLEGFWTNVLNPKVSMFYLAAFPQFISPGDGATSAYLLVSAHALLNLLWFSSMVLLLSRLKSLTGSASFIRWIKAVTGVVFVGFGARLALLKP